MFQKSLVLVLSLLAVPLLARDKEDKQEVPEAVVKVLRSEAKMEVFYLGGIARDKKTPSFHDYAVVGDAVEIKSGDKRKELVDTLLKDIAAGGGGPKEFKATHGIRLTQDGVTVDILLGDSWAFIWYKNENRQDLRLGNKSSVLKALDAVKPN